MMMLLRPGSRFLWPFMLALLGVLTAPVQVSAQESKSVAPESSDPDVAQSPALQGYCPVTYLTANKAEKGDPAHQVRYAGELYYFTSDEAMKKFISKPDLYLPQLGGWCAMALGGPYGNKFEGDPQVFMLQQNKLFLFSSPRAKNAYFEKPEGVLERAEELFDVPQLFGYCPVSYQTKKEAVKGSASHRVVVRKQVYYLSGADEKKAFAADPDKYLPQYLGMCVTNLANGHRYQADAARFRVHEGKTYLFLNDEALKKFDDAPAETIEKADANWKLVRQ